MTRPLLAGAAVALVAAVVAAHATAAVRPVTVTAALMPQHAFFGDAVQAHVRVVSSSRLRPGQIRIQPRFAPFRQTGRTRVRTTRTDELFIVEYTFTLACLERACLSPDTRRQLRLQPVKVRTPAGTATAGWPTAWIDSRVRTQDLASPTLHAPLDEPGRPSYRVQPTIVGWSLAGMAGLLIVGTGGALALTLTQRRGRTGLLPLGSDASPLEHALVQVQNASAGSEPERRRALESLARALEDTGLESVAEAPRAIAWSRRAPGRRGMRELAAAIREAIGRAA
jgi:hypothetical protein